MRRVLQIVDHMGTGGIQAFIMNVYRNIDREKIQFDFLVHRHFKNSYEEEIIRLGGNVFCVPSRRTNPVKNYLGLVGFFRNNKYDVIHMHESSLSYLTPLSVAERYGVKTRIIHSHSTGVGDSRLNLYLHNCNKKRIHRIATEYLACGEKAGEWMFSQTKVAEFLKVKNGIDISKYEYNKEVRNLYREKLHLGDSLVVGHVGRFSKVKNHLFLVDVFNDILKYNESAKLVLVGDGEQFEIIQNRIEDLGITKNTLMLGRREDIPELLQAMDIMIVPSYYEGYPITVVEAEAAGLPIVMSDTITKEVILKENVRFLDINDSPRIWAKVACENTERMVNNENLYNDGLDISNTVDCLFKIYTK